jgi:hypothetical protein
MTSAEAVFDAGLTAIAVVENLGRGDHAARRLLDGLDADTLALVVVTLAAQLHPLPPGFIDGWRRGVLTQYARTD